MMSMLSRRLREPRWADPREGGGSAPLTPNASTSDSLIEAAMAVKTVQSDNEASSRPAGAVERWNRDAVRAAFASAQRKWPEQCGAESIAQAYEKLKANLWIRLPDSSMKILLVVGVAGRSGVLTSATNLAASLAQDPVSKVLLMTFNSDAHQRHRAYVRRAENTHSFEEVLAEPATLNHPDSASNLCVLAAKCSAPLSIFRSEALDRLFDRARDLFDYVVIDAPPIAKHPETLLLTQRADAVLLEIESERTRKQEALWAKQQIETAGGKLAGVVLTERRFRIPSWIYRHL
jgi:Mrp family chromosome partitioning ATPase